MESKCVTYENCYATICKWALNDRDKTPAKSKFNNYEDTNKMDYAAIEEKLLDMQLGM
ncbi:MAG: hypothetical protein RSB38_05765 [Oscillospiraceae bacterium]